MWRSTGVPRRAGDAAVEGFVTRAPLEVLTIPSAPPALLAPSKKPSAPVHPKPIPSGSPVPDWSAWWDHSRPLLPMKLHWGCLEPVAGLCVGPSIELTGLVHHESRFELEKRSQLDVGSDAVSWGLHGSLNGPGKLCALRRDTPTARVAVGLLAL
uniref:Uncharacterized protein n=1 Tax=Eutreptiella gymnastica TaxID=73025 RepID=A0A7S1NGV6_9EUGL|mmetsp:Transcript_33894/g.60796  ORF Transcript_33894/g.60796 Transcript_33894/m.60796 type:complete len:155 (+) Transcript_33894:263-727(+)